MIVDDSIEFEVGVKVVREETNKAQSGYAYKKASI
jgi:hypothetical protein